MPHIHKLYDFTVSFAVIHDEKILLVHHKRLDRWMQPGGHIELDETPEDALWRELEEETGLTKNDVELLPTTPHMVEPSEGSKTLPLPFDINVHYYDVVHQHIDLCYLIKSHTTKVRLEEQAAHDIGWYAIDEVKDLFENNTLMNITYNRSKFALDFIKSVL